MKGIAAIAGLLAFTGCAGAPRGLGADELACSRRPNCVSSRASDGARRVAPFAVRGDPADAWRAAQRAVAAQPRTRVVSSDDRRLRAEATSRLFGFVDDLELRRSADGTRIDVRSASRVGWSDLGVNRARVESLRAALRAVGAIE